MSILILNETDPNRFNCVKYARARRLDLPFGLWNIFDKIRIINSCKPEPGAVAVMSDGMPWGHLGIVQYIKSEIIVITEANFKFGKITQRAGRQKELKILGYFV